MLGMGIRIAEDRNSLDTQFSRSPNNSAGDLTSVGNQDFREIGRKLAINVEPALSLIHPSTAHIPGLNPGHQPGGIDNPDWNRHVRKAGWILSGCVALLWFAESRCRLGTVHMRCTNSGYRDNSTERLGRFGCTLFVVSR